MFQCVPQLTLYNYNGLTLTLNAHPQLHFTLSHDDEVGGDSGGGVSV